MFKTCKHNREEVTQARSSRYYDKQGAEERRDVLCWFVTAFGRGASFKTMYSADIMQSMETASTKITALLMVERTQRFGGNLGGAKVIPHKRVDTMEKWKKTAWWISCLVTWWSWTHVC